MNITDIVDPAHSQSSIQVDVSDLLGEPEGTTVFVLREPSWNEIVHVTGRTYLSEYRRRFPEITELMALQIELLCICHESPAIVKIPPAEFYYLLSRQRPAMFGRLIAPLLQRLNELDEQVKKSVNVFAPDMEASMT